MDFYFTVLTAATVSLDSFVAGLSIGSESGKSKQMKIFLIMTVVAALCAAAHLLGRCLAVNDTAFAIRLGGAILVAVGAFGLAKNKKTAVIVRKRRLIPIIEIVLVGFGVGVDGACACLSLTLLGRGFMSAVTVFAFHYLFIEAGVILSRALIFKRRMPVLLSPILLILLGLSKLLF